MLEVIEKLLILQDRDRKIGRVKVELSRIEPEREGLRTRVADSQGRLEATKHKLKQVETERKKLELDVEAKKQQIEKYSLQQFQTKKNEEYRALAHEIENCKAAIYKIEDQQLDLMEKAEAVQKEVTASAQLANDAKKLVDGQIAELGQREQVLRKQLGELEAGYEELQAAVDEDVLNRYQRLRRQKGDTTVVGIEHSVCGGCHMKLPIQIVYSCQGQQEIVSCPNCGRILYYTPHMDLVVAE